MVSSLVLLCAGYRGVDPTGTVLAFGAEEDRLLNAGDIDGAVALNVDAWLGPDASGAARESVRVMQRRAFDLQLAEPEHPGPDQIEVDPSTIDVPALVVIGEQDFDHFIAGWESIWLLRCPGHGSYGCRGPATSQRSSDPPRRPPS